MDFFEAQARAKKHTSRLIVMFGLAVLGTILAAYLAAVLILGQVGERPRRGGYAVEATSSELVAHWVQPQLFLGVTLVTLAVVGIASMIKWGQFSSGGGAVAESVGGRQVDPKTTDLQERRLLNIVEEMAIASGTPVPAVYVLDDEPGINAFAAGLTTSDAVVAVTRGTLEKLNRDELQGVVAHEFSHILNGDMRLNMRLTALIFGILVLGLAGRGILWSMRHGRVRTGRGKNNGTAVFLAIGVALLIVGYVGYFFGRLIQAAVSRQREFLADASAVQFTRNPGGIMGALKKIGGYALGSSLQSTKSEAIGHFFFAQGFRSFFGGLWATHPPLDERLRAIDPKFDGQMFAPPEVVDVARESFQTAGFAGGPRFSADETARRVFEAPADVPPPRPPAKVPFFQPADAVAKIGTLTVEQINNVHLLLETIPAALRDAAHTAEGAPALIYGLLLDGALDTRRRQLDLIATRGGPEARRHVEEIEASLRSVRPEQKLPLLQLALPTLRTLPAPAIDAFIDTLDELVHADASVSIFEFALQKLIVRTLAVGQTPKDGAAKYHSFQAVADEIAVVLSALARNAVADPAFAPRAFAVGASHLKLIESRLQFQEAAANDLARLDAALDKLAFASLPIKQRTLIAAAHIVSADGQLLVTEAELLRAIAAALDVPMPPLG